MESETNNLLRALLTIAVEMRTEEARKLRKDEKILTDAGLNAADIASILGKSQAAVAKAIQRARKS